MSCNLFLKVNISYMHARALPPPNTHTHTHTHTQMVDPIIRFSAEIEDWYTSDSMSALSSKEQLEN
jgi:hypothetical protein